MTKYKELRNLSGGHETYSKTAYFRNCIGRNKGQQQGMTVCMHHKDFFRKPGKLLLKKTLEKHRKL